jgi:hypothetical protein
VSPVVVKLPFPPKLAMLSRGGGGKPPQRLMLLASLQLPVREIGDRCLEGAQKEDCARARAKNNERVDILLTCIVSLLAAIIGGWIAGKYALRAQKQAAEDQRQRDVEAERRMINNTLQAIGTELTVLKADFLDRLQQVYDGHEDRRERGPIVKAQAAHLKRVHRGLRPLSGGPERHLGASHRAARPASPFAPRP